MLTADRDRFDYVQRVHAPIRVLEDKTFAGSEWYRLSTSCETGTDGIRNVLQCSSICHKFLYVHIFYDHDSTVLEDLASLIKYRLRLKYAMISLAICRIIWCVISACTYTRRLHAHAQYMYKLRAVDRRAVRQRWQRWQSSARLRWVVLITESAVKLLLLAACCCCCCTVVTTAAAAVRRKGLIRQQTFQCYCGVLSLNLCALSFSQRE